MADAKTIWTDVLNDLLILGTLAANLFVKNPAHQQTAAGLIKASGTAIQLINSQINPEPANSQTGTTIAG